MRLGVPSVVQVDGFIFAEREVAKAYVRAVGSFLEPSMIVEISKLKDIDSKRERAQAEDRADSAPSRNALHTLPQRVEASRPASGMIVVNVERGTVGGVACEVVDGRELRSKLGSRKDFSNWMKGRIAQLNFVKNQDFEINANSGEKSGRGRPPIEYSLTLKMAKKIAMSEHTDEGNAVRDYFLDRERISYEAPQSSADIGLRLSNLEGMFGRMEGMFNRAIGLAETVIEKFVPQVSAAPVNIVEPAALNRGFEELRQQCLKQSPGTVGRSAPGRFEQISRLRRRVGHGQSERSEDRMNHGGPSRRTDCRARGSY